MIFEFLELEELEIGTNLGANLTNNYCMISISKCGYDKKTIGNYNQELRS